MANGLWLDLPWDHCQIDRQIQIQQIGGTISA
jgi:hypothetical protein